MLGWFRPKCPVDPHAKKWIEERLRWLSDEFGRDVFARRALILPLEEFFPERYDATPESVQVLANQVCAYMDVDPDCVQLEFYTHRGDLGLVNERGQALGRAVGTYHEESGTFVIRLETSQFDEPMMLVGTIAHELAHLRLLGERRISSRIFDNELLTDLAVVFHGLGIFVANAPGAWERDGKTWPGTDVRRAEYMTQPMVGYALAHAAWFRNERKPLWAKHLRLDARASFKQGLRYLWETADSQFKPPHAR